MTSAAIRIAFCALVLFAASSLSAHAQKIECEGERQVRVPYSRLASLGLQRKYDFFAKALSRAKRQLSVTLVEWKAVACNPDLTSPWSHTLNEESRPGIPDRYMVSIPLSFLARNDQREIEYVAILQACLMRLGFVEPEFSERMVRKLLEATEIDQKHVPVQTFAEKEQEEREERHNMLRARMCAAQIMADLQRIKWLSRLLPPE